MSGPTASASHSDPNTGKAAMKDQSSLPSRSAARRLAVIAGKTAVASAASFWVLSRIDWSGFSLALGRSNFGILLLVLAMRFVGLALSSFKWQILLRVHDVRFQLGQLIKWYLVATFLNNFLPTSIGGDGYRILRTYDNEGGKSCAIMAVLADRLTGISALFLLGYLAAFSTYTAWTDPLSKTVLVAGTIVIMVVFGSLYAAPKIWRTDLVTRFTRRPGIVRLQQLAGDFRKHPGLAGSAIAVSVAFHINKLLVVFLVLSQFGGTMHPFELVVVVLVVELIAVLPISLGGIGVVEGSFIVASAQFGIGSEIALATMLALRVLALPMVVAGAFFYVRQGRPSKALFRNRVSPTRADFLSG